jgi:hypothetical protein
MISWAALATVPPSTTTNLGRREWRWRLDDTNDCTIASSRDRFVSGQGIKGEC